MTTINISLPEQLRDFIEAQVSEGGYSTVSEYIRELVREAQQRKAEEKLEALLLEGLSSGPAKAFSKKDLVEIRRVALKHFEKKQHANNLKTKGRR